MAKGRNKILAKMQANSKPRIKEKISIWKIRFLYSFLYKDNRTVYEIMSNDYDHRDNYQFAEQAAKSLQAEEIISTCGTKYHSTGKPISIYKLNYRKIIPLMINETDISSQQIGLTLNEAQISNKDLNLFENFLRTPTVRQCFKGIINQERKVRDSFMKAYSPIKLVVDRILKLVGLDYLKSICSEENLKRISKHSEKIKKFSDNKIDTSKEEISKWVNIKPSKEEVDVILKAIVRYYELGSPKFGNTETLLRSLGKSIKDKMVKST